MQLVLMSDVHGNCEALRAVQATLPAHDRVIVAGDICLGGPRPAETADLLRELGWEILFGNRDRDVLEPPVAMKPKKRDIADWTRERLGPERCRWLRDLPFSVTVEADGVTVLAVHANPLNLDDHLYPTMTESELEPYLSGVTADILAFGHLHIPYARPVSRILLLDVASVGHPKDRDHRAAFTVVEWEEGMRSVTQVRVSYSLDRTIEDYRSSDMPHAEDQISSLLKASY